MDASASSVSGSSCAALSCAQERMTSAISAALIAAFFSARIFACAASRSCPSVRLGASVTSASCGFSRKDVRISCSK